MKKRIVVVDDDQSILDLIQHYLKGVDTKYEVTTAMNGNEALKVIDEASTDLLITDIRMPEKDGISLITEVRRRYPSINIISMSAGGVVSPAAYLNMAELSGSSCRLEKPFSKEELLSALRNALNGSE